MNSCSKHPNCDLDQICSTDLHELKLAALDLLEQVDLVAQYNGIAENSPYLRDAIVKAKKVLGVK